MSRLPFEGRLLVCDMDGTLLDSSSKLSMGNKRALDRFVAGGGLFTVATGRMEKSVMRYINDLPINVPAIVYNGAAIHDLHTDRLLWQNTLGPGVLTPIIKGVIEQFPDIGVEVYHDSKMYLVKGNEYTHNHILREQFVPIIASPVDIPQPWTKAILAWDPLKLTQVEEFLKGFDGAYDCVYSEPHFLEMLNQNTSKGSALRVLRQMRGLDKSCIIAMGDNLNDLELIKEADVGIAVENAHDILKAAADLCCTSNDDNAVSEVIGWLEDGKIAC